MDERTNGWTKIPPVPKKQFSYQHCKFSLNFLNGLILIKCKKYFPILGLDVIMKTSSSSEEELVNLVLLTCENELSVFESIYLSVSLRLDRPTQIAKDGQDETG